MQPPSQHKRHLFMAGPTVWPRDSTRPGEGDTGDGPQRWEAGNPAKTSSALLPGEGRPPQSPLPGPQRTLSRAKIQDWGAHARLHSGTRDADGDGGGRPAGGPLGTDMKLWEGHRDTRPTGQSVRKLMESAAATQGQALELSPGWSQ